MQIIVTSEAVTTDRERSFLLMRTTFWLGAAILLGAMVVGLFYSLGQDRALPRVQLAYYPDIEKLVGEREYRRALDQIGVALHLDFLARGRIIDEIRMISFLSWEQGRWEDNIRASNLLIELKAADEETYFLLATSLLSRGEKGDYSRSERLSRELLKEFPNQPEVNCNLGEALLYQQRWQEAEQYLVRALELEPRLQTRIQEMRRSHE